MMRTKHLIDTYKKGSFYSSHITSAIQSTKVTEGQPCQENPALGNSKEHCCLGPAPRGSGFIGLSMAWEWGSPKLPRDPEAVEELSFQALGVQPQTEERNVS